MLDRAGPWSLRRISLLGNAVNKLLVGFAFVVPYGKNLLELDELFSYTTRGKKESGPREGVLQLAKPAAPRAFEGLASKEPGGRRASGARPFQGSLDLLPRVQWQHVAEGDACGFGAV